MDGSWVVEGDEDHEDRSFVEETPSPQAKKTSRRQKRSTNKSPEPEFRMPRVDVDESMEASWVDETRNTRAQKNSRSGATTGETRRRLAQSVASNGTPEKAIRTRTFTDKGYLASQNPQAEKSLQVVLDTAIAYTGNMLRWSLDVLGGALRVLKTPITYILALWLLFGLGVLVRNLVTSSVYASLSPICRIPGASFLDLPFCPVHKVDSKNGSPPPVEFDQLMSVQSKFEEVLEETAGGVSLPMDMKRGEASIRDLRQLVRYSQLQAR